MTLRLDYGLRSELRSTRGIGLIGRLSEALPLNVLDHAPSLSIAAQILAGTYSADIEEAGWLDTAANAAVAAGRKLLFPSGTYTWKHWEPPAGLRVVIDGITTRFKQLDTLGYLTRFITVDADDVELFEGQSAFFDGSMTNVAQSYPGGPTEGRYHDILGVNATSFNSFVQVFPTGTSTIKRFKMGNVYALNCGGDIFECGAAVGATLGDCQVGTLWGNNVFQSMASITSGQSGYIEATIQLGGVGFYAVNFEPNATSPRINSWTVGRIYGNRISVVGDEASPIGHVRLDQVHLDYGFADSSPPYPYDSAPSQGRAGQWRNVDHLDIGQFTAKDYPYGALWDINEAGPLWTNEVSIKQATLINCGATIGFCFSQHWTRKLTIGALLDVQKPSAGISTVALVKVGTTCSIGGGKIKGRFGTFENTVRLKDMEIDCNSTPVFRACAGKMFLDNVSVTDTGGTGKLLEDVTTAAVIENSTITVGTLRSGSPNARLKRTTINGTYTEDGYDTKTVAALPAVATVAGARTEVTDSTVAAATNFGAIVAGGGANRVPVYSDGTNWRIG